MSLRIALPPHTMGLYRDIYVTVILYALHSCEDYYINVRTGYDYNKSLDFVEIVSGDIEEFAQCFIKLYNLRDVKTATDLQSILYDTWNFSYNPEDRNYIINLGPPTRLFPMFQKPAADIRHFVRFFYSRDVKTFSLRRETVKKGRPEPQQGFMAIEFDPRILWLLGKYRPSRVNIEEVQNNIFILATDIGVGSSGKRYKSLLFDGDYRLIDTGGGEKGKGETLRPSRMCSEFISTSLAQKDVDLAHSWFVLLLLERVLRENIDISEFTAIPPFRVYSVNATDPRVHWVFEVNLQSLRYVKQSVDSTAADLGVPPIRLVSGLRRALEGIAQISSHQDREKAVVADTLKTSLRILLRETFEGRSLTAASWLYEVLRKVDLASQRVPELSNVSKALGGIFP